MASQYTFGRAAGLDGGDGEGRRDPAAGTKVCPRCGARLFEDMDVCYGCLFDFRNPGGDFVGLPDPEDTPLLEGMESRAPSGPPHAVPSSEAPSGTAGTAYMPNDPGSTLAFGEEGGRTMLRVRSPSVEVLIPLGEQGTSFGRNPDNDVVLPARTASREHLRVLRRGDEVMAFDQGATNPALLNGVGITGGVRFSEGDVIEMGDVSVRIETMG